MNEQLTTALTALLNRTIEGVDASVDFLSGEIPLYVQELLMWKGVYSFVFFIIGIILLLAASVGGWFTCKRLKVWVNANTDPYEDRGLTYVVLGIVVMGIAASGMKALSLTWLQILIAPKVYIVEYLLALPK
jgi:hypothetical protein